MLINIILVLFEPMALWGPVIVVFVLYWVAKGVNYGVNYFCDLKVKTYFVGWTIIVGSLIILIMNIVSTKFDIFKNTDNANFYMYSALVFILIEMALPEINIPIEEVFMGIGQDITISEGVGGFVGSSSIYIITKTVGWGTRFLVLGVIMFVAIAISHIVFRYVPLFIKYNFIYYGISVVIGVLILLLGKKM